MSRICVKNLPGYVAEDRLREIFSQKGEVTDAKLMRTKDGKSRQFAFVGFRSEKEASEAVKYFHKSYLDTSQITCEVAWKVGDRNIPRPWSRHSAKMKESLSQGNKKSLGDNVSNLLNTNGAGGLNGKTKNSKNSKESSENSDPQLQEFLQIMQPRSKSKLWENDTFLFTNPNQTDKTDEKETQVGKVKQKKSTQMQDGFGDLGQGNLLSQLENKQIKASEAKYSHDLACDEVVSDMDYFNSRVKKDWSDSEVDNNGSLGESLRNHVDHEADAGEAVADSATVLSDKIEEENLLDDPDSERIDNEKLSSAQSVDEKRQAFETGRIFVRNLPYTSTEDDLAEHFSRFGDISQVHLVVDKYTKRSKGTGYVLYKLPESAVWALEELDNSIFQGRLLHVMPAKQHVPTSEKLESTLAAGPASNNFKQQKEEKRKASEASGDTRAWNSLFMRPDTVVESIVRKYGISKSDLLNPGAENLAVSLALGETQVIAETKEALANSGVNVAALEEYASRKSETVKRSNHVLLVKNLPYGSSEGDLAKLFARFGSLDKIILPPTKTLALVIFLEAAEARAAYKGLAYKCYKDAPLYLEWAPENILCSSTSSKTIVGEKDVKRVVVERQLVEIPEDEVDPDRIESRSVFVKNLNFKTSEESLRKYFTENTEGGIRSVKIKMHKIGNGKNVSKGFGFLEFDSMETAGNVCRDLQGTILDGHALKLQLCHAKNDTPDEQAMKKVEKDLSLTKLIVRNVAFEATEKDLKQLFSPFGQIKSLRLPMNLGRHRGFAFVNFITKQEAQAALKALSSTHLYGRHLVLERAKEGESLEELRARTAAQFDIERTGFQDQSKLSKKRKNAPIVDDTYNM